ncbi:helix-turn-helix domain-containing protein [Kibdelosporangium aridum]|uniref:AraC-like ligand-binding domain-containing protein n=1 Tax=Kibdelosporangium aridum TaxID=2030 RepID=UPI0007C5C47C|nr:helix-turn-helix domain-containing protein [Kibdelosporangium aridum]
MERTVWSTADVPDTEAFGYWADVICDAFVHVSAQPVTPEAFQGKLAHTTVDRVGISAVSSRAQRVRRTRSQIARGHEDSVLANIQLTGHGRLAQDDRVAVLSPGTLTFVDSSRPYSLDFVDPFSQFVIRVPRSLMPRRSLTGATAVALGPSEPVRLVTDFFAGLERLDLATAAQLLPHGLGLLECAVGWAAGTAPTNAALTRERVHRFVSRHAREPGLDVDAIAAGCGISRRTLYRVMADESVTGLIRGQRVAFARQMLRSNPSCPLDVVARACGFAGVAQFHRAFRTITGMTPATYRSGTDRHRPWHRQSLQCGHGDTR